MIFLAFLAALALLTMPAGPSRADYSLVWSDEFDGDTLDTASWNIDIGNGCPDLCGWGNNELQYYRAQNLEVTGGNLVITARNEYFAGHYFTSGKVHTRGKHSFLYGRIEMRAKLPQGGGLWPAFWMMPQDDVYGGWAASGEIDIMEAANAMTEVGGTLHFGGSWPENTSSGSSYSLGGTSFADDFHVYAVEWEPEQIRWYVDDVLFATRHSTQWYSTAAPGNPLAPFDQPFYIILNAAVGGNYTGCIETSCITADFPQQYLIDYVRVYQETGNQAPTVAVTAPLPGDNPQPGQTVTIAVQAEDEDGTVARVEFHAGDTLLGTDTTRPFAWDWVPAADGCYWLTVRAVDDEGAFAEATVEVVVGAGCGQAAFPGLPPALPAVLEAEDFDQGGPLVAYHDLDAGNNGNVYRTDEDVDIENCSDQGGGFNVGWIDEGEWLEYTLDVPAAGTYPIEVRVASLSSGGTFRLEFDGVDRTGEVAVPVTGGWQQWTTVTTGVQLPAGVQVMRFVPTGSGFNLNRFEFLAPTSPAGSDLQAAGIRLHGCYPNPFNPRTTIRFELPVAAAVQLDVYDVAGRRVRTLAEDELLGAGHHQVVWDGRSDAGRLVPAGVYFCRMQAGGFTATARMALVK